MELRLGLPICSGSQGLGMLEEDWGTLGTRHHTSSQVLLGRAQTLFLLRAHIYVFVWFYVLD